LYPSKVVREYKDKSPLDPQMWAYRHRLTKLVQQHASVVSLKNHAKVQPGKSRLETAIALSLPVGDGAQFFN
jgi:hypothetical protein